MTLIRTIVAAALAAAVAVAVPSFGDSGAAHAKAHAKPGKPGQCGPLYYYSKKERQCLNATFKK